MVNFIEWLVNNFSDFISVLSGMTLNLIDNAFGAYFRGDFLLHELDINLALFSAIPILSTNVYDLLLLVFSVFYTVVFVVIIYKIIKKVLVTITRWNRW